MSSSEASIYRRVFKDTSTIRAREAKELFFLTPNDLKYLSYQQEKGWAAYCSGQGAAHYYNAIEVRNLAVNKYGSIEALEEKDFAKRQRRSNKIEKERAKEIAAAEAERVRRELAVRKAQEAEAAKKQAAAERKRKAEEQVNHAAAWCQLLLTLGMKDTTKSPSDIIEEIASKFETAKRKDSNLVIDDSTSPATKRLKIEQITPAADVEENNLSTNVVTEQKPTPTVFSSF